MSAAPEHEKAHIPIIGRLTLSEFVVSLVSGVGVLVCTIVLCVLVVWLPEPSMPGKRPGSDEILAHFFLYPAIVVTGFVALCAAAAFLGIVVSAKRRLRKRGL